MAERPIFIPAPDSPELVKELSMHLVWNPGFAPVQKKKNVIALHASAAKAGCAPLLEVSTKSHEKVGQRLSAFNLKVYRARLGKMPLETAFQGGKVFARGGPHTDLYVVPDVRDAKRDLRLTESGPLTGFKFEDIWFPLEPKTASTTGYTSRRFTSTGNGLETTSFIMPALQTSSSILNGP
jgi:hypothetical protein